MMETLHLTIEGMTCDHCVRAVDNRLRRTDGVVVQNVVIGSADVSFDSSRISENDIAELIADEGYTAFRSD